ncbi:MAG TPA: tetratricopeptide repeat protein [Candidatus Dormibacteraeota bacterium]|nr:tetratricopeptide repeat protein [Candidatus Dormibacteraeota bacterium]
MIPLFFLLLLFPLPWPAQTSRPPSASRIRKLYEEGQYAEIVAEIPASPANSAELDLYRGLALARLNRWTEARAAFRAGLAQQPTNERFLVELAGVDYLNNNFREAKKELRRALALRPGDAYARNFLATIYMTEGNLEAALGEWNRIGKPQITAVRMNPKPRLRNTLLERAFTFSPLGTLRLRDLETTEALLDNLGIFPRYRFDLSPSETGSFAVDFQSIERHGWGSSVWDKLARLLRDMPTEIRPEYYNLHDSAINIISLYRWDENQRRVSAAVSMPLGSSPRWRLTLQGDARNENWDLSRTFRDGAVPLPFLNLEKVEFGPQLRSVESGRWSWQTGIVYAYLRFRDVPNVPPAARAFFTSGGSIEYRAGTTYRLINIPERRLTVDSGVAASFGKHFARALGPFGSIEASVDIQWFPKAQGQDYQTSLRLRTGRTFGPATLDQLYQLGVERDNHLPVRGISGTREGRKGNAPLGREFALWNWETDKTLFENGYLTVQFGPSFDIGRIADPSGMFGSTGWLLDPGFECKFRILGDVQVVVSYGYDIHSGSSAFYESASR